MRALLLAGALTFGLQAGTVNYEPLLKALSQDGGSIQFSAENDTLVIYTKQYLSAEELLKSPQGREDVLLTAGSAFAGTFMVASVLLHPDTHTWTESLLKAVLALTCYGVTVNSLMQLLPHTLDKNTPGVWGILNKNELIINHCHCALPWKNIVSLSFNVATNQIEITLLSGFRVLVDTKQLPVDSVFFIDNIIAAYAPQCIIKDAELIESV